MSNSLLLSETCKFKLKPSMEQRQILEELFSTYRDMVGECLRKAMDLNITSRKRLHESIYKELRAKHPNYPSHYIYTAITMALGMYKSYRRVSRKGENVKPPSIEELKTILLDDTHLFWFNWGGLKLATHKGHILVPFEAHEHSKKFMGWSVKGSRLLRKDDGYFFHITFRRNVEERMVDGLLGIDVNEKSIDLAVVKPGEIMFVKLDISEAKYIRDRYFKKRQRIQSKTRGRIKAKLLAKYSGREKRRINSIIHKASKIIAEMIIKENVKPVMEKLKKMRKRIRYGRMMNRRLHSMPFRKIQSYISYKSIEGGYKPEYVDARNTSRVCPICGELNKPNGHAFKCKRYGFQTDRHLVAAWNIAVKLPMCRPLPLAAKAINEAFKAEVERIVIKC
ncbi:MAG: transposase [archaeon YNP-LCB-003-016]|uniref:RNA-guided endonuclease InsQ/TnpB family protein n=1 Tax=Candidatus Culexarchaeum yellowstonense TaxID=2928963 RepID=UPI0026F0823D|nr:transposase [Candidatus Culexarchaeum yellowstonense]MCR6692833.1 transposase [Candidatus Culexarchaeum yellowstonense]